MMDHMEHLHKYRYNIDYRMEVVMDHAEMVAEKAAMELIAGKNNYL